MPSCAIITCRKRSQVCSVAREGISFHRFPTDPDTRKLWIEATGRIEWRPTKCSTICSQHFEDNNYTTKKSGKRYLKSEASPCKNIVMHFSTSLASTSDTVTQVATTSDMTQAVSTVDEETSQNPIANASNSTTSTILQRDKSMKTRNVQQMLLPPANASTPRKRQLQNIVNVNLKDGIIRRQRLQIKRIQAQNRRLKRKLNKMEEFLLNTYSRKVLYKK